MAKDKHIYTITGVISTVTVLADTLERKTEGYVDWLILTNDGEEVFRIRMDRVIGWSRLIEKRDF